MRDCATVTTMCERYTSVSGPADGQSGPRRRLPDRSGAGDLGERPAAALPGRGRVVFGKPDERQQHEREQGDADERQVCAGERDHEPVARRTGEVGPDEGTEDPARQHQRDRDY